MKTLLFYLRTLRAQRKLEKLRRANISSPAHRDWKRRHLAAKKGWAGKA